MGYKANGCSPAGVSPGTSVDTTTPGDPDLFSRRTAGDRDPRLVADARFAGGMAVEFAAGSAKGFLGFNGVHATSTARYFRARWQVVFDSLTGLSGSRGFFDFLSQSGNTTIANIVITPQRKIAFTSDWNSGGQIATVSTDFVNEDVLYDVVVRGSTAGPAGSDFLRCQFLNPDASVAAELILTNLDLGSNSIGCFSWGWTSTGATASQRVANIQVETGEAEFTTDLAPPAGNQAPILQTPASVYVPVGQLATMQWQGSDPDGTVASGTLTQVSNGAPSVTPTGSGLGPWTFTPTQGYTYAFDLVVTDDDGATSNPSRIIVGAYDAAEGSFPQAVDSNTGGWAPNTGAIPAALVSTTDAAWVSSPAEPASDADMDLLMTPLAPTARALRVPTWTDDPTSTAVLLVQIRMGPTKALVAEHTVTPAASKAAGEAAPPVTLTEQESAALTDRAQVYARLIRRFV